MDRRSFLTRLGSLTAGAAGAAWLPAPLLGMAGSRGAPLLGINTHLLTAAAIRQVRDLGLGHVRTTIYWPLWERDHEGYRSAMAAGLARTEAAGLEVLVVVHNAWGDVFHTGVDPAMWDRFADWVAGLALRFPSVEAWQLWNEQEVWVQAPFGAGATPRASGRETGRSYARQLELAYPRIKQANPRALVVTGGTADHPQGRWRGFLRGMMESEPPCDAVALHSYGLWSRARGMLTEAREAIGPRLPLWLTEFGMDRPDRFSEDRHLETWRSVIVGNEREPLAARLYPYCLQTDPRHPGHGLFAPGGAPRPAYEWLRRRVR